MKTFPGNPLLLIAAAAALVLPAATCHGLAEAFGGDIWVDANFTTQYDSNVASAAGGEEDVVLLFGPTIEYVRPDTLTDLQIIGFFEVAEFIDDEADDTENYGVEGSIRLPTRGSPLNGLLQASFLKDTEGDNLVNTRVESVDILVTGNLTYDFNETLGWSGTAAYDREEPEQFSGTTEYSLRNELVVRDILDRLGVSAGVEFERQETEGALGQELTNNNFALVFNVTGELLPENMFAKLDADLGFGFRTVNNTGGNGEDETIFIVDGSLVWQARERTSVGVFAVRDVDLAPNDTSTVETQIFLEAVQEVGDRINVVGTVGYEEDDFVNLARGDETWYGSVEGEFLINEVWTASLGLLYEDRDSDVAIGNFDRLRVTASTVYRF
jgi:hypothetical protein